jgi:uroporphyrinogen-III decarboxylase
MKQELHRAFPTVTYWNLDDRDDTWTMSGAHGAYIIPALFGCALQYELDRWPLVIERPDQSLEDLAALDIDELMHTPMVQDLDRQMDILQSENGKIHGYLHWAGVLNNAFNIRGQDIFTDMALDPETTHRFLRLITDVMIRMATRYQQRQTQSGFPIDHFSVSNCTVNLISPPYYREFIFPYDNQIAKSFPRFGVHTCNWNVNPYLDSIHALPKVGYMDMGIVSDMRRAKELFPQARRAMMYSPVTLHDATREQIARDMQKVYEDLAPCDIVMADIQSTTPDSRVNELLQICAALEDSKNGTLEIGN